jgi:hypothetical protein
MDSLPSPAGRGKSPTSRNDYTVGICLLLLVVFLWTGSNFVTQDLFVGGYGKPFLITYLSTSSFFLYLVPFLIKSYVRRHQGDSNQSDGSGPPDENEPLMNEDGTLRGTVRTFVNRLEVLMIVRLQESTPSINLCTT